MVLLMVFPRIDPRFSGYDEETKASLRRTFSIIRRTITLFLSIVAVAGLPVTLHPALRGGQCAGASGGLLIGFDSVTRKEQVGA